MLNQKTNTSGKSGKGLIENIVRFSNLLRDNGIRITLTAVLDSIAGLPLIEISNRDTFQCLLQANFISRKSDIPKFNRLFSAYWLPAVKFPQQLPADTHNSQPAEEKNLLATLKEKNTQRKTTDPREPSDRSIKEWALRYSPQALADRHEMHALDFDASRTLAQSIIQMLQPLTHRLSRRYQYTLHGKAISLRKVLRKNMQFGGELILLDFKKRRLKKRRVIFVCDVSGSMDVYTLLVLQFIHALKQIDRRTEIFFFSTDLSRATRQFAVDDFTAAINRMPELITDWGGGTRIGHCLKNFNETFGIRQLSNKDIVMIFSDGWDRGEMDVLEAQMMALKRKAYKIIWLNPLSGTQDYQPSCQGMRTALPHVDYFLPMGNLQDLRAIGQTLRKLMV